MEAKTLSGPTSPNAQLETVISRPNDGLHILSWGSRDNSPTDTGIEIGAKLHAFQKSEKIGPISDGVPKRDIPGGPITTWEFVYHFPDFSIISYLRGSNLNDFETHDPASRFFDVIPKTRTLLGKVLPERFMEHAKAESEPVQSWDSEKLDRYALLLDSYTEWKKQGGGFKDFESGLFGAKMEQAFSKVTRAIDSREYDQLKTVESNRAYNFFMDYLQNMISMDSETFIASREQLVMGLGKGLVEVASDGSDIFSFFQIKGDPQKYIYDKTQQILAKLSHDASDQFTSLIAQIISEQEPNFSQEIAGTSLYALREKKPEFKHKFTELAYQDFLQVSPLLLLSNPKLDDPSGSGSILDQAIESWVSDSIFQQSFFGRVHAQVQRADLPHYAKHFMDSLLGNYMSGGFEPSAASEMFLLLPDVVKKVKSGSMSEVHRAEISDLLKRLERLPDGQVLLSDYESAAVTGANLKSALTSTMKKVFDETFASGGGSVVQSMRDETAKIEASASQVYRLSCMANKISGFDASFLSGPRLVPTPDQLIATIPVQTEYVFDVAGTPYIASDKTDVAELIEMGRAVLSNSVIAAVASDKNALYAKAGRELDAAIGIAESVEGGDTAGAAARLKEFVSNLSWSKDVPEYDPVQSGLYSKLVGYLSSLSDAIPSKIPSKLRSDRASQWQSDRQGFLSDLEAMDRTAKSYEQSKAVLGQVDSLIQDKLGGKAAASAVKEEISRVIGHIQPLVVEHPVGNPFKQRVYSHLKDSATQFYSTLLSKAASFSDALSSAAPDSDASVLLEPFKAQAKQAYDAFVGLSDQRFLADMESFFDAVGESIAKATTREELVSLGVDATSVSSHVVYVVVGEGVERKYTEDEIRSLDAVSRLWTPDRVSGVVEKRMREVWETEFFKPVKEALEKGSGEGCGLRQSSQFLEAYKRMREQLGQRFPGEKMLDAIDSFYQKSKWEDKLYDISNMKDRWGRMQKDVEGLQDDVLDTIAKDYKRFRKSVPLGQADTVHPFFKNAGKVAVRVSQYNTDEVQLAITNALKGDAVSNKPFLSLDRPGVEPMAVEMKGAVRSLFGAFKSERSRKDARKEEPKEYNEKFLSDYAAQVVRDFREGFFGNDPENVYRVMELDGKRCVLVSELDSRLDPESVFGKGLVSSIGEGQKYLGVSLPYQGALPAEVTSLPSYALYRAGAEFQRRLEPSKEFLAKAASRVHPSVQRAALNMLEMMDSRLSYRN